MKQTLVFLLLLSLGLAHAADRLERSAPISGMVGKASLTAIQTVNDHQIMVGESGHIVRRSADGSLIQAQVPVDVLLTSVFFSDQQNGWAVGHDGVVLHSSDSGQTWHKQLDGNAINQLSLAWASSEIERLRTAVEATPGDASSATALDDAQFALDDIKAGSAAGPTRPLLDAWFRNDRQGWVVGAYGTILATADAGQTWRYVPGLINPDRLHLNTVLGLADGSLLVGGEGGRVYRSADGGVNWHPAQVLGPASLYKIIQLKDGTVLTFGFGGALFVSHDSGQTWKAHSTSLNSSLYGGTQLADGSVLLTGQGGVVLYGDEQLNFRTWRSGCRASWLGVVQTSATQVALIGTAGLLTQNLPELKEHL